MDLQKRILQLDAIKAARFDELKAARNRVLDNPTTNIRLRQSAEDLLDTLRKLEAVTILLNAALFDLMISGISHRRYMDFVRRLEHGE